MVSRHLPLLQRSYTFLPSSLLMTAWHIPTPFTRYGNNINFKANLLSAAHKNTLGYFEQTSHFQDSNYEICLVVSKGKFNPPYFALSGCSLGFSPARCPLWAHLCHQLIS